MIKCIFCGSTSLRHGFVFIDLTIWDWYECKDCGREWDQIPIKEKDNHGESNNRASSGT